MRLITILFFCSRLLSSLSQESFSQEIDCNDDDVLMAVDAALKKYNDGNQSGNQFVLYRISNATKMDDFDTFYSFKYQIKEGDCPVQSGKPWQECGYKQSADAATGECTVTVAKKNRTFTVATQTCQITPAEGPALISQHTCRGCRYPISTEDTNVKEILKHAVSHFNNNSARSHLFVLGKTNRAYKEVVDGWNFDVSYSIMQTNCSKADFPLLTPDCQILSNGVIATCTDRAYIDLSQRIASFSQQCYFLPEYDFDAGRCIGCPKDLPLNSSDLNEILNHTSTKLNADYGRTFYFKIDNVKKATVQVVSGLSYRIKFTAKETICPKESNTKFTSSCETKEPGQVLICDANIYIVPWMNKTESTVNCDLKTVV
ncbi:kininogen-1-like [Talpa occidentalis]|uniref:kininogen-1-like n=1 Tax=Talpa occidentalis TaxID=50954 RepID=UPI0023F626EF|nr:kininogen-1-like [Talpa occidentalis]